MNQRNTVRAINKLKLSHYGHSQKPAPGTNLPMKVIESEAWPTPVQLKMVLKPGIQTVTQYPRYIPVSKKLYKLETPKQVLWQTVKTKMKCRIT